MTFLGLQMLSVPLNKRVKPSAKPTLLMPISCHQGPDMGVPPRGESESAAPPNKKCRPAPQKRDGNSCIIIIIINGLF